MRVCAGATERARYRWIFTPADEGIPLIVVSEGGLNPHAQHLCRAQVLMWGSISVELQRPQPDLYIDAQALVSRAGNSLKI